MDFWKDIKENDELKEEFHQALKASGAASDAEMIDAVAKFARDKGYEVLDEDIELTKAKLANIELSDEELSKISGGKDQQEMNQHCFADYLCTATWNACWFSNECFNGDWDCDSSVSDSICNRGSFLTKGCSGLFWGSNS